jgi:hypothetical protein
MKNLVADRRKPNKLKRHLETVHIECVGRTPKGKRKKVNVKVSLCFN